MTLLEEVFERAGVQIRTHQTKANEITACCPFCIERDCSEDTKFRLGINTAYAWAHCFKCGFKCRGLRRLLHELCRVYDLPILKIRRIEEPKPEPVKEEEIEPYSVPKEYERFKSSDPIGRQARKYVDSRGISTLQIVKHKIGFCAVGDYSYRIILPVIGKDLQVYGFASRSFVDAIPKYLNSPGLKLLWTSQRVGTIAIEAEGILDALAIERATTSTIGAVAVSPLGSSISSTQLAQLVDYGSLIMLPDRDLAGVRGCLQRAKLYAEYGLCPKICIPDKLDGRDPADMHREEILDLIQNAKPWTINTQHRLRRLKEAVLPGK